MGDVAVGPGDLQLPGAFDKRLEVDEGQCDYPPVFVELDAVALGARIRLRRERVAVLALDVGIEHVAAFVVRVIGEDDTCNRDAHRWVKRGSLSWSSTVTIHPGSSLKSTTTLSHRPRAGKSAR